MQSQIDTLQRENKIAKDNYQRVAAELLEVKKEAKVALHASQNTTLAQTKAAVFLEQLVEGQDDTTETSHIVLDRVGILWQMAEAQVRTMSY